MGFGLFKKIKDAVKKVAKWTNNTVLKPVINTAKKVITSPTTKKLMNTAIDLAPVIAGGIGSAYGNPQAGFVAGNTIKNIGNSIGLGRN